MDTTATLEPQRTEIEAGQVGTVVVSVRNDSEIVEEYTLQVVGDLAESCTVEPTHVSVYPGQSATAVLTVSPPRSPDVAAGEYFYGVHVLPTKRAENATVPEGTIDVLPFHDTAAELSPQTSRSKRGSRYRVAVENRGNAPVLVTLAAKSASDELDLALGESELTVGPGATVTSEILAEPVERLWRGTPVAYPFTVSARPDVGPEIVLAGTQYQEPVLPAWTFKALLGLVALAVLGVVAAVLLGGDEGDGNTVAVPAVAGKSLPDAEAALEAVGLEAEPKEVFHGDVAEGMVVRADPAEGTDADKDEPVVLEVSKGPEPSESATVPAPDVPVPVDLVGRTEAEARAALESAGLVAGTTSEVDSASVAEGVVIETEPVGGTTLPGGSEVRLVVSTGMVTVPDLVGLTQDEAIAALGAADVGLIAEVVPVPADDTTPGQVVEQDAAAGESVAQGSTVTLSVAEAPPPSVPGDVEVVAAPGVIAAEVWPEDPWAGSVAVTSIVLDNPSDYAGTFSIQLQDTVSGTQTLLHRGELSELVEGQDFVVDPEESAGDEALEDGDPDRPAPGPIQRIGLTEGQNLVLAMSCATLLADGSPQDVSECSVTFTIDGEVSQPGASG